MSGVAKLEFPFGKPLPPWDIVTEVVSRIDADKWMLIGGLMVQAHAMMAELESRATVDVDLLIDVLADTLNIGHVIAGLEELGFELHEPGLRGAPFHRLKRDNQIIDVLIADHLPSGKSKAAKIGLLHLMETPGGAQTLNRRTKVAIEVPDGVCEFYMPDVLGALVLKSAVYRSDNRDKDRHLSDAALLASLVTDIGTELSRLHGSDRKRLRSTAGALADSNHPAWMNLPSKNRLRGQDVLRILSSD
ncbi:MAG: hypothetical protein FWG78_01410 [Coriobacteriia bacterium]|nr:hypothetical protein [Coriobacteriia bacterium]